MKNNFYKNNDTDQIWWVDNPEKIGEHLFTFDKKKIYNLIEESKDIKVYYPLILNAYMSII